MLFESGEDNNVTCGLWHRYGRLQSVLDNMPDHVAQIGIAFLLPSLHHFLLNQPNAW